MARMFNPPHPGVVMKDGWLIEGETVSGLAEKLGVSRVALSRVLNGRAAISPELALKLGKVLGHSPESWLHMQADYDLWQAEQRMKHAA